MLALDWIQTFFGLVFRPTRKTSKDFSFLFYKYVHFFFCTITEICKKYSKWEEFYQQMSRDTGVVLLCHLGSFVSCFIIHLIIRSSKLCLFHVSRSFLLPFILSLSSFRSSVLNNQIFCKFLSDHLLSSFPLLQFSLKITCSIIFQN